MAQCMLRRMGATFGKPEHADELQCEVSERCWVGDFLVGPKLCTHGPGHLPQDAFHYRDRRGDSWER
jgi:hypothetical protein